MMVFSFDEDRLLVILQIDHSRLVGYLAAHWGNERFAEPDPWNSFVLAAQEHDNGWWDWEVRPTLNEQGYPPDYVTGGGIPRDVHVAFDRHGIQRVVDRDTYAGLLVSFHQAGLNNQGFGLLPHMPDRSHIPEVALFLKEQERVREQLRVNLCQDPTWAQYADKDQVWINYKLLEAQEQLGQVICNRYPLNSSSRKNGPPTVLSNVPVAPGEDDVSLKFEPVSEDEAVIHPYPFDMSPLPLKFPARLMPDVPYASQDEFLRDYYRAEPVTINYRVREA